MPGKGLGIEGHVGARLRIGIALLDRGERLRPQPLDRLGVEPRLGQREPQQVDRRVARPRVSIVAESRTRRRSVEKAIRAARSSRAVAKAVESSSPAPSSSSAAISAVAPCRLSGSSAGPPRKLASIVRIGMVCVLVEPGLDPAGRGDRDDVDVGPGGRRAGGERQAEREHERRGSLRPPARGDLRRHQPAGHRVLDPRSTCRRRRLHVLHRHRLQRGRARPRRRRASARTSAPHRCGWRGPTRRRGR